MRPGCAVLFLIDGLRPDALAPARAPTLERLAAEGASTLDARSVTPSLTLPCLTSLLHGVDPATHGVLENRWKTLPDGTPSLMEVLHRAGLRSFAVHNWVELHPLLPAPAVHETLFLDYRTRPGNESERVLFETAGRRLSLDASGLTFLYYGALDVIGHASGWMSPAYVDGVAEADTVVAGVLASLPGDALVVVVADHGGHDKTHGTDRPEDMRVPLIVSGPGIPRGHTIRRPVSLLDLAPTLAAWFGVPAPARWTGSSILNFAPVQAPLC